MINYFNNWKDNTLSPEKLSEKIFIYLPECGLGDKITCFPAFRILKLLNLDKRVVLITEESMIDIWKLNKYIDFVIPAEIFKNGLDGVLIRKGFDIGKICDWTFFEHHQQHIVKSAVRYIVEIPVNDLEKKYDLTYEFELNERYLEKTARATEELLNLSNGKRIVGVAPANTMISRMWPLDYWKTLVDLLRNDLGYFVVALGGHNDLVLDNVDLNALGRYPIAIIPKLLDNFDYLITVNSGMIHIGSVNQDVKMIYINSGQFPEEIILPFRKNNNIYHNRIILNHKCEYKRKCFEGHITNREINKQMNEYLKEYLVDTGEIFPENQSKLLQKYTCWHYCYKDRNKFSCTKQITPEMVIEKLEEDKQYGKKVYNIQSRGSTTQR